MKPILIEVNWSYPTSPNAERAGCSKTGCWTVSRIDRKRNGDRRPPKAVKHFATREEANSYALVYQREIAPVIPAQPAAECVAA
jgi:hypothetical protein